MIIEKLGLGAVQLPWGLGVLEPAVLELAAIVIFVFLLSTLLIYIISILGTSPQTFEEAVRQQRQTGFDLNAGAAAKANAAAKKKEKERARKERKRAEAGGGGRRAKRGEIEKGGMEEDRRGKQTILNGDPAANNV